MGSAKQARGRGAQINAEQNEDGPRTLSSDLPVRSDAFSCFLKMPYRCAETCDFAAAVREVRASVTGGSCIKDRIADAL